MDILDMQFLSSFGHLLVWHAKIVSGEYKQRKVSHGLDGPEFSDEEKLSDSIQTMGRHVARMDKLSDLRPSIR